MSISENSVSFLEVPDDKGERAIIGHLLKTAFFRGTDYEADGACFCSIHYFGKKDFSFHVRSVLHAADTIRGLCTFLSATLKDCKSGLL